MPRTIAHRPAAGPLVPLVLLAVLLAAVPALATPQSVADGAAERARALQLVEEGRFVDAMPLLERVVARDPNDAHALEKLAASVIAYAQTLEDAAARREQRARARKLAARVKELGGTSNYTEFLLGSIPEDGGDDGSFSPREEVEAAMRRGEAAFARGDHEAALEAYTLALTLDPKLYEAALYIGDVYYVREEVEPAAKWFRRAAEIDPDRETAYRYWGDALTKAGRRDEALDRFVEAIVAEPFARDSRVGLVQWAGHFGVELHLPRIDTESLYERTEGGANVTVEVGALGPKDGSVAWLGYAITRAAWGKGKFKQRYPNEQAYRHTLEEEAEALTAVAAAVDEQLAERSVKEADLQPELAYLRQLRADGLIEAYVLFALPDEGIARDYEAWRKANRDKMRRFLVEYVVGGKGIRR